jgi:hypothetical protein
MNVRQNHWAAETADDNSETNYGRRREDDRRGAESVKIAMLTHGR